MASSLAVKAITFLLILTVLGSTHASLVESLNPRQQSHLGDPTADFVSGVGQGIGEKAGEAMVGVFNQTYGQAYKKIGEIISVGLGEGATPFNEKARPFVLTIVNDLFVRFKLINNYQTSGTCFGGPSVNTVLLPGESHTYYFANKDGSFMTGAAGWVTYNAWAPSPNFNYLSVVFSHPYSGSVSTRPLLSYTLTGSKVYDCYEGGRFYAGVQPENRLGQKIPSRIVRLSQVNIKETCSPKDMN